MYRLYNHCFDCQIKFENKLRIEGKLNLGETKVLKTNFWIDEQNKVLKNGKNKTY